ncbi:glycosyltransferase family 4 protein [Terrihabitans rhizophilus]|uniref:Glycosyltransferase family 4 protein n=1 Tax=Terrihabitans rhizophilus TaxID=3092662 RepID=A0ABU4RIK0_9HYPH|nr:glycosyltransferase family 4 protein [Terrihabitans sp. PJ23]MDX6804666.1 glycosyltransferase family 4 protein [Terrihabitans sp. PJ23]
MRIAQIAPLCESCPPQMYGGTERVVSWLTEELVKMGHEVTLYASGDSLTSARLVAGSRRALRLDETVQDFYAHHMVLMNKVLRDADDFDVLHFHTDYLHFPTFANGTHPIVTTMHGRQDLPDLAPVYREFAGTPLVSISDDQRRPVSFASWTKTIYHGLPKNLLPFGTGEGGYLAFVGRTSPEKGLDRAIEIARKAGIKLKIAAKVDKADKAYFHEVIEPLIDGGEVEFVGEINEVQKRDFLGHARALLFPIRWPEPFGLVMIEAMSCGTPVLAFRCGSVPEVMEDGLTGFIVDSMDEAHDAVPRLLALDRRAVRERFEQRFTSERMARDYVALYETLMHRPALPTRSTIEESLGTGDVQASVGLAAIHAAAVRA